MTPEIFADRYAPNTQSKIEGDELSIAVQALRDVVDPIGKFKRELEPGYKLDGAGCVMLLDSTQTYRDIAREALRKLGLHTGISSNIRGGSMTTVIYHSGDFDGKFCEQIARKALGPHARYIGYEYGELTPVVPDGDLLYMLDISIPELMDHNDLIWIDHHKTAIERYGAKPGFQIDGVAACRLAWQWFFGDDDKRASNKELYVNRELSEPLAVRLAGEYDIWDKRDPNAELFQHGLRSMELSCKGWDQLLTVGFGGEEPVQELLSRGAAVEYYVKSQNESIIKHQGFDLHFEDKLFLALNAARYNSLAFEAGLRPEHDGCLGFKWVGDKWSVSMYGVPGKPDEDFTPIATKYGGGGHKQACGFTAKSLPWLETE